MTPAPPPPGKYVNIFSLVKLYLECIYIPPVAYILPFYLQLSFLLLSSVSFFSLPLFLLFPLHGSELQDPSHYQAPNILYFYNWHY
jgi:hypothetical protein